MVQGLVSLTIENCTLRVHRDRAHGAYMRPQEPRLLAPESSGLTARVAVGWIILERSAGRRRRSLWRQGRSGSRRAATITSPPRIWPQGSRPGFQVNSVEVGSSRRFPRWTNRTASLGRTGRLKGSRLGGRWGHLVQVGLGGHSPSVSGRQGGCRLQPRAGSRPWETDPVGVGNSEPGAPGAPGAPGSLRIAPMAIVTVPDAGDRAESRPCPWHPSRETPGIHRGRPPRGLPQPAGVPSCPSFPVLWPRCRTRSTSAAITCSPRIWPQGSRPGFQVSSVEAGSSRRFSRWTNRTAPLGRTLQDEGLPSLHEAQLVERVDLLPLNRPLEAEVEVRQLQVCERGGDALAAEGRFTTPLPGASQTRSGDGVSRPPSSAASSPLTATPSTPAVKRT